MNDQLAFDYEIKFVGENSRSYLLANYLDKLFQPDAEYPEAIISSIYFDSLDLALMQEKVNSDYEKTKIRYRSYLDCNHSRSQISFKEIKHKLGDKRYKVREKVETNHDYFDNFFKTESSVEMNQFKSQHTNIKDWMVPMFTIQYSRKRYVTAKEQIRICLDTNIHVGEYNRKVFNYKKNTASKLCVFEIKGRFKEFPLELKILEKFNFKLDSFSKYLVCAEELLIPLRGI